MPNARPVLQVGDVVRLSKRGLSINRVRLKADATMIVLKITPYRGDANDGRARVKCNVMTDFCGKVHGRSISFLRKELWRTGYNINDTKAAASTDAKLRGKHPCKCPLDVVISCGCQCGGY